MEASFLANVNGEMATNPDVDAQYQELIPGLRKRMMAIRERFKEPSNPLEEDVLMLAERELAFLASQEFQLGVLKGYAH